MISDGSSKESEKKRRVEEEGDLEIYQNFKVLNTNRF